MNQRFDGLTGLRGVAALTVVIYHYNTSPLATLSIAAWLPPVAIGYIGVDLFFIISGFVLSLVHLNEFNRLDRQQVSRFLCLRLARIYPLYLLTLIFMVVVTVFAIAFHVPYNSKIADFRLLPECLLLVQAWYSDGMFWNYPSWSLSAEWFVYLLFPFIAFAICSIEYRRSMLFLGLVIVSIVLYLGEKYFHNAPLLRGTVGFLLGIVCYLLTKTSKVPRIQLVYAIPFALFYAVISWGTKLGPMAILLFFSVLVLTCAHPGNPIGQALAWKPIEYIGQISYALYLVHAPVQMVLGRLLLQYWHFKQSWAADLVVGAFFLLGTLVLAHAVYRYVELPARLKLRSLMLSSNASGLPGHRFDLGQGVGRHETRGGERSADRASTETSS